MCLKKDCKNIRSITIDRYVKMLIHTDINDEPILIQYWKANEEPHEEYLFVPIYRQNI